MKVKLKSQEDIKLLNIPSNEFLSLEYGVIYDVMGVFRETELSYYYIDVGNFYPINYTIELFEIVDPRVSKHWIISIEEKLWAITFKEWIEVPNFIHYYLNGDVDEDEKFYELREFIHYKKMIKKEFS